MAEINAVDHIRKIFEAAQKLMAARQAAVLAARASEEAERDLLTLNGSTNLDLSRYHDRRFFECEGDRETRLKYGTSDANRNISNDPKWRCPSILGFESWQLGRDARPKDDELICSDCKQARALRDRDMPAKAATAEAIPVPEEMKPDTKKAKPKDRAEVAGG